MTIAEYIQKHKRIDIFTDIIIVKDGEFDHYFVGRYTPSVIIKNCGNRELWNAIVKNEKLFLFLENTDKIRGGMTVKSYLYKHKNILSEIEGVVLWIGNKSIVYTTDRIDDIFIQQYEHRIIEDISISRDLYIHLKINGTMNGAFGGVKKVVKGIKRTGIQKVKIENIKRFKK